jgi:hypothetical protein
MKKWFAGAVVVVTVLIGGSALAHEGGKHVRGIVKEVSAERLVLTTADGEEVSVVLEPDTRITRGTTVVHASDVHSGDRAVVHAKPAGGRLQATEVKLGDASGKK